MTITSDSALFGPAAALTVVVGAAPSGGGSVVIVAIGDKTATIIAPLPTGWTVSKFDHPDTAASQILCYRNGARTDDLVLTFDKSVKGSWVWQVNDARPYDPATIRRSSLGYGNWNNLTKALSQTPTQLVSEMGAAISWTLYPRDAVAALASGVRVMDKVDFSGPSEDGKPAVVAFKKTLSGTAATGDLVIWPFDVYAPEFATNPPVAPTAGGDEQPIISSWLWQAAAGAPAVLTGGPGDMQYVERPTNFNGVSTGPISGRLTWTHPHQDEILVFSSTNGSIDSGNWLLVEVLPPGSDHYDIVSLPIGTPTYWQVKAIRVASRSAFAAPGVVTITAPGFGGAPIPPTIDALAPNTSPRRITGTGAANAVLRLYIDAVLVETTTVDSTGAWAATFVGPTGTYAVTADQVSAAGASALSASRSMVIVGPAAAYDVPRSSPTSGKMLEEKPPPVTSAPLRPDGMVGAMRIPSTPGRMPEDS